ncbi:DNA methyltransferase [Xylophilus rhododendri]|uniref:DNA (cytosine-5-)-methyltransferase n=1 Tax=Xylophilus rhododendri TaxID=2697032 RepID=A0A857J7X9_9BURK|nr:DNA cytosine methyltransferase [Xylophilus rhododendri]QHJ00075.1 DNA methyltransferase [Xylophilus rhododendri]
MKRDAFTMPLGFADELIIDNFAGGGGTSTGLEAAFGRPVDIAINHDPEALAMHAINHPRTLHLLESVWDVDPIKVTKNQPVGLVWLSPDCKHFSKAKGGTPVAKHIRGLAWVGMRWIARCKPRVMMLENVEEFTTWGPLLVGPDGLVRPDPAKRGKTFESFVRQLRAHGYQVEWRELRACDNGAPTIRKRLFMVARRDGLPIVWPEATHGEPTSAAVLAGKLLPWRSAAECIDFTLPARSVFDRKKALADNTLRRVAKGLWRHVLTSPKPFIVGVGGRMGQSPARGVHQPVQTITSKADSALALPVLAPMILGAGGPEYGGRPVAADRPLGAMTTENHRAVVAPTLHPLRGTDEPHLNGDDVAAPLSTISAGGTHHALSGAHLITVGYGERPGQEPRALDIGAPLGTVVAGGVKHAVCEGAFVTKFRANSVGHDLQEPLHTVTANSFVKRPGGSVPLGLVAAHLVDMGHGEGKDGTKRFSHGIRSLDVPLNTVTASGATSAIAAVCLEQANGGFYDGDGRAADAPMSTITAAGSNQRLITAYCVKYYSSGGQWQGLAEPMHTLPTKGRMGLVQVVQVSADCLAPDLRARAKQCAELLHLYLPEHFPEPADLVLVGDWVLVDITLRMLKAPELFLAQSFPPGYVIHEIPDPTLLFAGGMQATEPLLAPRIPLTATAQVRMCDNSVAPAQAEALARANFAHEAQIHGRAAA